MLLNTPTCLLLKLPSLCKQPVCDLLQAAVQAYPCLRPAAHLSAQGAGDRRRQACCHHSQRHAGCTAAGSSHRPVPDAMGSHSYPRDWGLVRSRQAFQQATFQQPQLEPAQQMGNADVAGLSWGRRTGNMKRTLAVQAASNARTTALLLLARECSHRRQRCLQHCQQLHRGQPGPSAATHPIIPSATPVAGQTSGPLPSGCLQGRAVRAARAAGSLCTQAHPSAGSPSSRPAALTSCAPLASPGACTRHRLHKSLLSLMQRAPAQARLLSLLCGQCRGRLTSSSECSGTMCARMTQVQIMARLQSAWTIAETCCLWQPGRHWLRSFT